MKSTNDMPHRMKRRKEGWREVQFRETFNLTSHYSNKYIKNELICHMTKLLVSLLCIRGQEERRDLRTGRRDELDL